MSARYRELTNESKYILDNLEHGESVEYNGKLYACWEINYGEEEKVIFLGNQEKNESMVVRIAKGVLAVATLFLEPIIKRVLGLGIGGMVMGALRAIWSFLF